MRNAGKVLLKLFLPLFLIKRLLSVLQSLVELQH